MIQIVICVSNVWSIDPTCDLGRDLSVQRVIYLSIYLSIFLGLTASANLWCLWARSTRHADRLSHTNIYRVFLLLGNKTVRGFTACLFRTIPYLLLVSQLSCLFLAVGVHGILFFFCMPLLGVKMDVVLIDPCGTVGKPKPDIATTKLPYLGVPHFFCCLAFNATTGPGIAQPAQRQPLHRSFQFLTAVFVNVMF